MLAARAGRFGALRRVISEREMRSHDGRHSQSERRYGVRLGGVGRGGDDSLHYPDMVLVTDSGHRVAGGLLAGGVPQSRLQRRQEGGGLAGRIAMRDLGVGVQRARAV